MNVEKNHEIWERKNVPEYRLNIDLRWNTLVISGLMENVIKWNEKCLKLIINYPSCVIN